MKKIILFILSTACTYSSAKSLHPCTPRIPAQPIYLTCSQNNLIYSIRIDILRSKLTPECSGSNYFENKKALINVSNDKNQFIAETELFNNDFSFSLGYDNGAVTFNSAAFQLDLKNCGSRTSGSDFQ